MSDRYVVEWRKRRGGVWVPEDRIRASLWGAGCFVPLSVLLTGLTIKYVPGTPGIVLNLLWLFMNGIGVRATPFSRIQCRLLIMLVALPNFNFQVDIVLTPSSSYYVDIMHSKSAETMAASA